MLAEYMSRAILLPSPSGGLGADKKLSEGGGEVAPCGTTAVRKDGRVRGPCPTCMPDPAVDHHATTRCPRIPSGRPGSR